MNATRKYKPKLVAELRRQSELISRGLFAPDSVSPRVRKYLLRCTPNDGDETWAAKPLVIDRLADAIEAGETD